MSTLPVILTVLLGSGGAAGLVALLRFRTDKGVTVVETVSKGVLIMERLNDRLEGDLLNERAARLAAETERDELRRLLETYRPPIDL
jgi:hypothetical protein